MGCTVLEKRYFIVPLLISACTMETLASKFRLWEPDGSAINGSIAVFMHVTLYGFIGIHSVIDLLLQRGCKYIPKNVDWLSGGLAFLWISLGLYYHSLHVSYLIFKIPNQVAYRTSILTTNQHE